MTNDPHVQHPSRPDVVFAERVRTYARDHDISEAKAYDRLAETRDYAYVDYRDWLQREHERQNREHAVRSIPRKGASR